MQDKALTLKQYTPYVPGVIGADFDLTFRQRLQALIYGKVSVILLNDKKPRKSDSK